MPSIARISGAVAMLGVGSVAFGGSLTPPSGPVAPTPGPEPRIAINATNTPGDADSVYRITAPGSYYLTGSVAGVAGRQGIEIASSSVSVDLMGYELRGVAGSLEGVNVSVNLAVNVTVRNGLVRDWGLDGIDFAGASVVAGSVESIQSANNGAVGILVGNGTRILGCVARGNGGNGFDTGSGCTVADCIARDNTLDGFELAGGCTITGCAAIGNGVDGISAGSGNVVTACAGYSNDGDGISANTDSASITGCHARFNGSDGIQVSSNSHLLQNTCSVNSTGAGIHVTGGDNRIDGNHCADNLTGVLIANSGNLIIRNTCAGNTTNWDVAANNAILVVTAVVTPAFSGNAGGVSPGSTNPNANFSY